VRLYYNLGRRDGLSPEQIEQQVRDKGVAFQRLDVHNSHTYLIVDEATADAVIAALAGGTHNDRPLTCERARR
jgi:hypothetical protein